MSETVVLVNSISAYGGLALILGTAVLVFDLFTSRTLAPHIRRYAGFGAFLLSLFGLILTLVYSEVFGFVPCSLCWLQRIFLYPLSFIYATGLFMRDRSMHVYAMVLAVPGFVIAIYQHYLQMGGTELVGCPVAAGDCAQRFLFEFGFITFPLLAAILFAFLFMLSLYAYMVGEDQS